MLATHSRTGSDNNSTTYVYDRIRANRHIYMNKHQYKHVCNVLLIVWKTESNSIVIYIAPVGGACYITENLHADTHVNLSEAITFNNVI